MKKNKWKGFLIESKSFMDYENLSFLGKLEFWFRYPKAYVLFRYHYLFFK